MRRSVVVNDVRKAKKGYGLNASTNEIVDLVAAGVIDPAMVTRSALQNAASTAKNILTTEAIVAEVPEESNGGGGGGGGMPDMSEMMPSRVACTTGKRPLQHRLRQMQRAQDVIAHDIRVAGRLRFRTDVSD